MSTGVTIFVRNLPEGVTDKQLGDRFGKLGYEVKRASVTSKNGNIFGHVAFVVKNAGSHGVPFIYSVYSHRFCRGDRVDEPGIVVPATGYDIDAA